MTTNKPGYERRIDRAVWTAHASVEKWSPEEVASVHAEVGHEPTADELRARIEPEVLEAPDNMLLTNGLAFILTRAIGNGTYATGADNTHMRLGVGDNGGVTTANEAVGQTDLVGTTNKYFMTMAATFPQVAGGVLTAQASYASGVANYVWNEWCLVADTASTSAAGSGNLTFPGNILINRKVAALGTKASGAVWVLTATITIT